MPLVAEVAVLGEDHRHAGRVAGLDHLGVALRAAGLDRPRGRRPRSPACGPSANGKNASEATTEPASRRLGLRAAGLAALLDREPHRVDPAHLPGADPERRAVLGEHDRVRAHVAAHRPGEAACRATAPRSARPSVTTSISSRGSGSPSRSWTSRPPRTRFTSRSPGSADALLLVIEDPDRLLLLQDLQRPVLVAGRDQHLDEVLVQLARPAPRSIGRFSAITPPNADIGSQASAFVVRLERRRRRSPPRRGCCA